MPKKGEGGCRKRVVGWEIKWKKNCFIKSFFVKVLAENV